MELSAIMENMNAKCLVNKPELNDYNDEINLWNAENECERIWNGNPLFCNV